jgi:hypothetical protein
MAERPPHGRDEIPEGYEVEAVEEGPDWRTEDGTRRCSHGTGRCDERAVLALQRGTKRKMWYRYCPGHSYGRWVEDGKVMCWILREKQPDA